MQKVELGMGTWEICHSMSLDSPGRTVETVSIGCNGNWVFTDSAGNRYVPIIDGGNSDVRGYERFGAKKYMIISPWGHVSYLLEAIKK